MILNGNINKFTTDEFTSINNLRSFHNWVKFVLLVKGKKLTRNLGTLNLMDIAVGRGGDIPKWKTLEFKYVFAFDVDNKSIYGRQDKDGFDGAIQRLRSFNFKSPYVRLYNLSFLNKDILDRINEKDERRLYSIVSCQFAFHYFAENQETLDHALKTISNKLKNGGVFVATITDGDLISKNINENNINLPSLKITKKDFNSYKFYIQPQKTEKAGYFQITEIEKEYYVRKDLLIQTAKKFDLELVEMYNFYDLYKNYKGNRLSIYEQLISFLNFQVIFRKTVNL
jgi:SAM-dependent methyltransferase